MVRHMEYLILTQRITQITVIYQLNFIFICIVPVHRSNIRGRTPTINQSYMSKYLATVGSKMSILTGRPPALVALYDLVLSLYCRSLSCLEWFSVLQFCTQTGRNTNLSQCVLIQLEWQIKWTWSWTQWNCSQRGTGICSFGVRGKKDRKVHRQTTVWWWWSEKSGGHCVCTSLQQHHTFP